MRHQRIISCIENFFIDKADDLGTYTYQACRNTRLNSTLLEKFTRSTMNWHKMIDAQQNCLPKTSPTWQCHEHPTETITQLSDLADRSRPKILPSFVSVVRQKPRWKVVERSTDKIAGTERGKVWLMASRNLVPWWRALLLRLAA